MKDTYNKVTTARVGSATFVRKLSVKTMHDLGNITIINLQNGLTHKMK